MQFTLILIVRFLPQTATSFSAVIPLHH